MPHIQQLSPHVADLIAAGEVVERPASVVKELLENAIDAGAQSVTVEMKNGGMTYLRVSDDGCGIAPSELPTAFLRHATSKIRSVEELVQIASLGFRGEALSSISAVAQIEMITKTPDALTGTRYVIEGGAEKANEEVGAPTGTTFLVRNLFYNTPARQKFLKTPVTEANAVTSVVEQLALSHPGISFKYMVNSQVKLHTSGNRNLKELVYNIYGRDIARELIEIHSESPLMTIDGFIGKPVISRGNRNFENYYVNGRYVRSKLLARAIEDGYQTSMMQHKYPFTLFYVQMDGEAVDVNVHPAKIEARFARENDVFDVVYHAVKLALAQPGTGERRFTFEADEKEKTEKENNIKNENSVKNNHFTGLSAVIPGQAAPGTLPAQHWQASAPQRNATVPAQTSSCVSNSESVTADPFFSPLATLHRIRSKETSSTPEPAVPSWRQSAPAEDILDPVVTLHSPEKADATKVQTTPQPFRAAAAETQLDVRPETDAAADPPLDHMAAWNTVPAAPEIEAATVPYQPEEPVQSEQPEQLGFDVPQGEEPLRYVGEVFRTYILAERGDELCLIDKHAAHERQLYEKLAANYGNVPSQLLLQPAAIDLSAEEKQALLENLPLLENAGLDVADFGGSTVLLRAVPADVEPQNAEDLLVEIADRLLKGSRDALNEHTEWVLHSISCRAAIKAGDKSSPQELMALAEKILSGEVPPFCPHGRPCVLKLTRKELEKQFGRIV